MKEEKLNLVKPAEKSFVAEFKDRLSMLQSYFHSKYKPLLCEFQLKKIEDRSYFSLRGKLYGENLWSVNVEFIIAEQLHMGLDSSHLVQKYYEEMRERLEEAVRQEGIKSINQ